MSTIAVQEKVADTFTHQTAERGGREGGRRVGKKNEDQEVKEVLWKHKVADG